MSEAAKCNVVVFEDRFRIGDMIGKGWLSMVHRCTDLHSGVSYAVKIYNRKPTGMEESITEILHGEIGFTKVHFNGIDRTGRHCIVMDLLGPSLNYISNRFRLSSHTIAYIGEQLIDRIQTFHSIGFLHRDLHIGNINMGVFPNEDILYLIDFENASRIERVQHSKICTMFSPISSILQQHHYPICEIESIFYILFYIANNRQLPWSSYENRPRVSLWMKRTISPSMLGSHIPPFLRTFLSYIQKNKRSKRPDYDYLKRILAEARNHTLPVLEWTGRQARPNTFRDPLRPHPLVRSGQIRFLQHHRPICESFPHNAHIHVHDHYIIIRNKKYGFHNWLSHNTVFVQQTTNYIIRVHSWNHVLSCVRAIAHKQKNHKMTLISNTIDTNFDHHIEEYNVCIFSINIPDHIHIHHSIRFFPMFESDAIDCFTKQTSVSSNLLYVNFSVSFGLTSSSVCQERIGIMHDLICNGWPTIRFEPHHRMLRSMSRFAFVACPRGITCDSARFWDALSVGCGVIVQDWIHLRRGFRGRIPAIWIMERKYIPHSVWKDVLDTWNVHPVFWMDACGDLFVEKWRDVTKDMVLFAHRLIGWKRSSHFVQNQLVSKAYWTSQIYRSCT
jgi:serine/threonine protein kinase